MVMARLGARVIVPLLAAERSPPARCAEHAPRPQRIRRALHRGGRAQHLALAGSIELPWYRLSTVSAIAMLSPPSFDWATSFTSNIPVTHGRMPFRNEGCRRARSCAPAEIAPGVRAPADRRGSRNRLRHLLEVGATRHREASVLPCFFSYALAAQLVATLSGPSDRPWRTACVSVHRKPALAGEIVEQGVDVIALLRDGGELALELRARMLAARKEPHGPGS